MIFFFNSKEESNQLDILFIGLEILLRDKKKTEGLVPKLTLTVSFSLFILDQLPISKSCSYNTIKIFSRLELFVTSMIASNFFFQVSSFHGCISKSDLFSHRHSKVACVCVCVCAQLCLTLCDSMNCSPSGSSVPGISQARIQEWVAISFSRGLSLTQGLTLCLLHCRQIFYN